MQEAVVNFSRESTLIGHVVEVTAAYFRARMLGDENGFSESVKIGEETFFPGRVGSYQLVKQGGHGQCADHEDCTRPPVNISRQSRGF